MPKISVVVPCYNVEKYLGQMIESLQNQTLCDIEIILVDDGSPDNSGAICDEYAAKDDRIKVIHKPNGGVGAARNDGLDAATGEWIVFCDSDDWLEADALEKLIEEGEQTEADIVFGDVNCVYGDRIVPVPFYKNEFTTDDRALIDQLIAADFCRAYCFDIPTEGVAFGYGGPWNKLVRRQLLIDNNIRFDLRVKGIFDDIIYTAYIFAVAKKIAYRHIMVYNYRQLNTSITHTYKGNLLEIDRAIFVAWEEFMEKYGKDGRFLKPYYACVLRRLDNSMKQYFFHQKNTKAFRLQLKELTGLLTQEPYKTAVRFADANRLHMRFHRILLLAGKLGSAELLFVLYRVRVLVRKIKERK